MEPDKLAATLANTLQRIVVISLYKHDSKIPTYGFLDALEALS